MFASHLPCLTVFAQTVLWIVTGPSHPCVSHTEMRAIKNYRSRWKQISGQVGFTVTAFGLVTAACSLIDMHRNARWAEGGSPGGAHRHHPASSKAQPAAALLPRVPRHCRHLSTGCEGALCNSTGRKALHTSSQVGSCLISGHQHIAVALLSLVQLV